MWQSWWNIKIAFILQLLKFLTGIVINRLINKDDLIVFRLEERKWFLVVNGATAEKDAKHFQEHLTEGAAFKDVSFQTGKIDVQGPLSRNVLSSFVAEIEKLDYYTCDYFDLLGERVIISRTGYTGELGYEIYFPWGKTKDLWGALLEHENVKPAGLGARDILRIEMGYSLYGHELEEGISPLESGLQRFIDFEKDFRKETEKKIADLEDKLTEYRRLLDSEDFGKLSERDYVLWEIDFAEVLMSKGCFDIIIGNPP